MDLGRASAKRLANALLIACCVVAAVAAALIYYVGGMVGERSLAHLGVAAFAGAVIVGFGKAAGVLLVKLAERDER